MTSGGEAALISFFILLVLSLVLVRIFTVALTLTGLSEDAARFQARSAYTGTGFTTNESETVVNDPVRRRIVMFIMLLRGAGAISATVTLLLSFVNVDSARQGFERGLLLALGLLLLLLFSRSQIVNRLLTRVIEWALRRWTDVDVRDYVNLLHLQGGYRIYDVDVHEKS